MENNSRIFILTYGNPVMDNGTIHYYIGTISATVAVEWVLSGTYKTPIDVDKNL